MLTEFLEKIKMGTLKKYLLDMNKSLKNIICTSTRKIFNENVEWVFENFTSKNFKDILWITFGNIRKILGKFWIKISIPVHVKC